MTRADVLTLVAPRSLTTWYDRFCGAASDVVFIGEDDEVGPDLVELICARADSRRIRILSGHDSLIRDWVLGCELRRHGLAVSTQSGMATSAALDKMLQKRLLSAAGIAVPCWGYPGADPSGTRRVIWKGRDSTQSRAVTWNEPSDSTAGESFWEEYVEGVEYSVVLYREDGLVSCFPPVWKGSVREDLTPPWRRLRLVPSGVDGSALIEMKDIAVRIAELLDVRGFAEIEYIRSSTGELLVTDINPRICGTMRIVAMATNVAIFDPEAFRTAIDFAVRQYAAEIPHSGPPISQPNLIATSRLTCSGGNPSEILALLAQRGHSPTRDSLPEVWRAH